MNEVDDPNPFERLTLEEPSPGVDRRIRAMARQRLEGFRRQSRTWQDARRRGPDHKGAASRWQKLAWTGFSAAAVAAVAVAILGIPREDPELGPTTKPGAPVAHDVGAGQDGAAPPESPAGGAVASLDELRIFVDQLRGEVLWIRELSKLIPPEREKEREKIAARVKSCLADFRDLDEEIDRRSRSSL